MAALFAAALSVHFTREQVRLQKEAREEAKKLRTEDDTWSRKFSKAAELLCRAGPRFYTGGPKRPNGDGLSIIFPDQEIRRQIESHIIERAANRFLPRPIVPDQLRMPMIRDLVDNVLEHLEQFERDEPEVAKALKLL